MRTKEITLREVAAHVGCSTALVSHVLNRSRGNISCHPEMRRSIIHAARTLGYIPEDALNAQRSRKSFSFFAAFDHNNPAESAILGGILSACAEKCASVYPLDAFDVVSACRLYRRVSHLTSNPGIVCLCGKNADEICAGSGLSENMITAVSYYGTSQIPRVNFDIMPAMESALETVLSNGFRAQGVLSEHFASEFSGRFLKSTVYETARKCNVAPPLTAATAAEAIEAFRSDHSDGRDIWITLSVRPCIELTANKIPHLIICEDALATASGIGDAVFAAFPCVAAGKAAAELFWESTRENSLINAREKLLPPLLNSRFRFNNIFLHT